MSTDSEHFRTAHELWRRAQRLENATNISITGRELDIATVFAVSRGGCQPFLTDEKEICAQIHESVKQLGLYLDRGHAVYGENSSHEQFGTLF